SDVLHRAGRAPPGQRHLLQVGDPHLGPAGDPADRPVQGHQGRARAGARRRPDPDRRRLSRRGPLAVPPAQSRAGALGLRPAPPGPGPHGRPRGPSLAGRDPRKNVPPRIPGWAAAVTALPDPPALVLAGGSGWSEEVDDVVAGVPAHLRLVRPGYLRFSDLPGYLGGALVVAYPSRGEGFGLPVLEAMACAAPVLTTHRTSLPEVGGDAVAYTEPDADSIQAGLRALLDDPVRREALGTAGHARAQEFTWAASAEAHLASYLRAAGQR